MHVLLSIRPNHVENIFNGSKKFEFRRKIFARKDVRTVVIYCTMPVGCVVAEFDIQGIIEADPESLWKVTEKASGVSKAYFDVYFEGRNKAYALQIGEVRRFAKPIPPVELFAGFIPPQSYMYIDHKGLKGVASPQLVQS